MNPIAVSILAAHIERQRRVQLLEQRQLLAYRILQNSKAAQHFPVVVPTQEPVGVLRVNDATVEVPIVVHPSICKAKKSSGSTASIIPKQPVGERKYIVEYPGENDVMLGRGSGASNHIGNIQFRQIVEKFKPKYIRALKVDKPGVAEEVLVLWKNMNPPGRFLDRLHSDAMVWHEVDNVKARQKTSQCLREKCRDKARRHPDGPSPTKKLDGTWKKRCNS